MDDARGRGRPAHAETRGTDFRPQARLNKPSPQAAAWNTLSALAQSSAPMKALT